MDVEIPYQRVSQRRELWSSQKLKDGLGLVAAAESGPGQEEQRGRELRQYTECAQHARPLATCSSTKSDVNITATSVVLQSWSTFMLQTVLSAPLPVGPGSDL